MPRSAVAQFTDGRSRPLQVVGADPLSDLAVGRIDVNGDGLSSADLATRKA